MTEFSSSMCYLHAFLYKYPYTEFSPYSVVLQMIVKLPDLMIFLDCGHE